jgi:hypothetical protein
VQIAIRTYGSAISGAVPDSTTEAIDRIFDLVDSGVEKIDHVFNRGKDVADKHHARKSRRQVIEAEATPTPTKGSSSSSNAVARRPHFYVVESTDPVSGATIFVVTDGAKARTECSSREFANQILHALEKAP